METTKSNSKIAFYCFSIMTAALCLAPSSSWHFIVKVLDPSQIVMAIVIIKCTKVIIAVIWLSVCLLFLVFVFHKNRIIN
ncbi:MAG TPA: hypothetical protein VK153_01825 [Candidatus Paceibacterota bacterium]|nr:hypothetical protein [Candidatus Paceibacterota bacterium]